MTNIILEKIRNNKDDCEFLYSLQTIPYIRELSVNTNVPNFSDHCLWFTQIVNSSHSIIFKIVEHTDVKKNIGMIRIDIDDHNSGTISIIINPDFSGKGYAKKAIFKIMNEVILNEYCAVIHEDNIASIKAFSANDFIYFAKSSIKPFNLYKRTCI